MPPLKRKEDPLAAAAIKTKTARAVPCAAYFVANLLGRSEGVCGAADICAFVLAFGIVALISKLVLSKRCDVEIVKILE